MRKEDRQMTNKFTFCASIAITLFLANTSLSAQNQTIGILSVSDTASARKINEIHAKIKEIDNQLLNQNSVRTQAGLTLEMQERLQMRDDSIRMSLLSKRTSLLLEEKEVKDQGLRRVATNIPQVGSRDTSAQGQNSSNTSLRQMQRIYRQNQRRNQRNK